jgi:rubrerythrin
VQILNVLTTLGKAEMAVAEFYYWLSVLFENDPEASGFFFRMSLQEKSHVNLLRYAKKLAHRAPDDFADVDFDPAVVHDLIDRLGAFRDNNPAPTLAEALAFSMQVEGHDAEQLHRSLVIRSNPDVSDVINTLAKADAEHHGMLERFATERSLLTV